MPSILISTSFPFLSMLIVDEVHIDPLLSWRYHFPVPLRVLLTYLRVRANPFLCYR